MKMMKKKMMMKMMMKKMMMKMMMKKGVQIGKQPSIDVDATWNE